MNKKNEAEGKPTLTNAPTEEEITIASDVSTYAPRNTNQYYPGDSLDQHKEYEEANLNIAEEEIKQQNENL